MRKVAFFLYCLLLVSSVFPKSLEIKFEHLSVEQGLSSGTIYSILQDNRGFLWFGTPDGLNRYDGYNFVHYKYDPEDPDSISNNNAGNIYLDRSGNIWIGTWGGGLNKFDPKQEVFQRFLPDPEDPDSISDERVQSVFEDSLGQIWAGTYQKGLNKLSIEKSDDGTISYKFMNYQHDPDDPDSLSSNRIWSITEGQSGNIFAATNSGLNSFDQRSGKFTRFFHEPSDPFSLSNSHIRTLFKSTDGTIWIGTQNGLNRLDQGTNKFYRYLYNPKNGDRFSRNTINSIAEDGNGQMWIGSADGLYCLTKGNSSSIAYYSRSGLDSSLSQNEIRSVFVDGPGNIWIGTYGGGVNKYNPFSQKFDHILSDPDIPGSLTDNNVLTILEDTRGELWVGTDSGLHRSVTDRENGISQSVTRFRVYRNDPDDPGSIANNKVWSIYEDSERTIWVGTRTGGLSKFLRNRDSFKRYSFDSQEPSSLSRMGVLTIFEDKGKNFWIGSYAGGLYKFDRKSETFVNYRNSEDDDQSLGHDEVWSVFEDKHGSFWIGTGNGLNKMDRASGKFVRFDLKSRSGSITQNTRIFSIYEDNESYLWLGTDWGLHRFDKRTGEFRLFLEKNGLPSNRILGRVPDGAGNLWLSTTNGLSKFNISAGTFKNYDVDDGLQGREFSQGAYFRSSDGRIFFGGANGFNTFYPDQINENPGKPEVVLTGFKIFNKPVVPGRDSPLRRSLTATNRITLKYSDKVFSFEFSALDFTAPEYNKYAYILDGFDREWINTDADKRFAHYSNLSPGKYIFRVRGSNNDGIWNMVGSETEIVIIPPFWMTWPFRIIVLISGFIVLWGLLRLKTRNITSQNLKLEEMVTVRTRELMISEENYRVMIECSNDIIWTLDRDGNFTYSNKVAESKTGYSFDEWRGKSFIPMIVEDDIDLAVRTFNEIFTGKVKSYDLRIYDINKNIIILSANTAPIYKEGEIVGTVSFARDVTKERQTNEELTRYREDLEKRVKERTVELEQKNQELEQKNRELARFFDSTVDRELRMKELYDRIVELEKKADRGK